MDTYPPRGGTGGAFVKHIGRGVDNRPSNVFSNFLTQIAKIPFCPRGRGEFLATWAAEGNC